MLKVLENKIRSNLILYIFFIWIFKKFNFILYFLEKKQFTFLLDILPQYLNYKILNIGSNHNQNCRIILKMNNQFKVINFEPNEISLKNNSFSKNNNIKNKNFGALNQNVKKQMYVPYYKSFPMDSLTSLDKKNIISYFKQHRLDISKITFKKKICKFVKLDIFNYKTFLLKIDTEGSEIDVLKGLQKTIRKNNPIILIERNEYKNIKNISNLFIIEKFLKKFDYKKYYYEKNKFIPFTKKFNRIDLFFLNKKSFKYISKKV